MTQKSEVAIWHELSGAPDNVTSEGEVIDQSKIQRWHAEKTLLREQIAHLSDPRVSPTARSLARLAASYVLAGDAETARRYLQRAYDYLSSLPH